LCKEFKLKRLFAIGVLAILGGCSSSPLDPYYVGRWTSEDSRDDYAILPNLPMSEPSTGRPYLHVCYNKLFHDEMKIQKLVAQNCTNGELVDNRSDLYTCSLSAPIRATWRCDSLSRAASEARPLLRVPRLSRDISK
jgi:hypothetical protein